MNKTSYRQGKYSDREGVSRYMSYGIQHMGYMPVRKVWYDKYSIEIGIVVLIIVAALAIVIACNV